MKLHLGCWHRYLPGFTHVDLCDLPHIDYQISIDKLPMFTDGSVEIIYASHCLEYFDRDEALQVLREWHRVLRPGGTLRLAVPDFDALNHVYRQSGELQWLLGPLYGRMEINTSDGKRVIYHKTVYNFTHLKALLETSSFKNVHRYDWQSTVHKDFDDHSQAYFPHMDKRAGLLISLNVEAERE